MQLTTKRGGYAKESPDGSALYVANIRPLLPSLWRVGVSGGTAEQILPELASYGNFAVTREGVYFEPPSPGMLRAHDTFLPPLVQRGSGIDHFSSATGKTNRVIELPRSFGNGMDVSPDGRTLLFAQTESISEDLMLVENFH